MRLYREQEVEFTIEIGLELDCDLFKLAAFHAQAAQEADHFANHRLQRRKFLLQFELVGGLGK